MIIIEFCKIFKKWILVLHKNRIVYKSIKLESILVDEFSKLKLADFRFAKGKNG